MGRYDEVEDVPCSPEVGNGSETECTPNAADFLHPTQGKLEQHSRM